LLRQDNALRRLGPLAEARGLLTPSQTDALHERLAEEDRIRVWFSEAVLGTEAAGPVLAAAGEDPTSRPTPAMELLRRPRVRAADLLAAGGRMAGDAVDALAAVEVEIKYEGYMRRERERAARLRDHANFKLDNALPYHAFVTLSHKAREKLERVRPSTLAQAGRIPGVSPADMQNLVLEVRRLRAGTVGAAGSGPYGRGVPRETDHPGAVVT